MPDPQQQIAELEARIEDLFGAAERCRKILVIAWAAIGGGGALLSLLMLGLVRGDATAWIAGLAAVLAGIVLLGANHSTLVQITDRIKALEARRAQLIDGLDLRDVENRQERRRAAS